MTEYKLNYHTENMKEDAPKGKDVKHSIQRGLVLNPKYIT